MSNINYVHRYGYPFSHVTEKGYAAFRVNFCRCHACGCESYTHTQYLHTNYFYKSGPNKGKQKPITFHDPLHKKSFTRICPKTMQMDQFYFLHHLVKTLRKVPNQSSDPETALWGSRQATTFKSVSVPGWIMACPKCKSVFFRPDKDYGKPCKQSFREAYCEV